MNSSQEYLIGQDLLGTATTPLAPLLKIFSHKIGNPLYIFITCTPFQGIALYVQPPPITHHAILISDRKVPCKPLKVLSYRVLASIVFIYEYITNNVRVNQCLGFHPIHCIMEATHNHEVIAIHFMLVNSRHNW
jgi:hypothetical protein